MHRSSEFRSLQQQIVECRKCPRLLQWREQVAREKVRRFRDEEYWGRPVPAFGSPDASLVIIGLAPAAHGGNRTGRMFTGDSSGDWLFGALHRFGFANQPVSNNREDGLRLNHCLITAVARCAPPKNRLFADEIANCIPYLCRELRLTRGKKIVLALGQVAFMGFHRIWNRTAECSDGLNLKFHHGGEWTLNGGLKLFSSYHPSRQNTQTGRLSLSMFHQVFRRARAILDERD